MTTGGLTYTGDGPPILTPTLTPTFEACANGVIPKTIAQQRRIFRIQAPLSIDLIYCPLKRGAGQPVYLKMNQIKIVFLR